MHTNEAMSKTPVKWTPAPQRDQVKALYQEGKTPTQIAEAMGYATTSTVYRWLHKLRDAGEIEPAGEQKTA
jgi:transposase-like protein